MAIKTSFARWVAGTALSAVGLWSGSALAVAPPPPVPATLTQQGRILDSTGTPVSSKVAIAFTIYDSPTASAPADALWTETQNITLDDGYFSAQLGSTTPFTAGLFSGATLYLGVTVGSDAEMTPREAITSVPYSMLSGLSVTALSAPFTGLTGIPALCPTGQYLKGYNADGTAACGTLPALSCTVRYTAALANVATAAASCNAGEVMTGGGCSTTGSLTSSFQDVCQSAAAETSAQVPGAVTPDATIVGPPIIVINPCLFATGKWTCDTTAATTSVQAFATCCTVQ